MADPIGTDPSAYMALFITFSWGSTGIERYTNLDKDITVGLNTFKSHPQMEAQPLKLQGGVNIDNFILKMGLVPPINRLVYPAIFYPVFVLIQEADPLDMTSIKDVFCGTIFKSLSNADKQKGLVRIEIPGHKSRLISPLGLPVDNECIWNFGDKNCKFNLEALKETGTIATISGNLLIATGLTMPRDEYWHRGTVRIETLELTIFEQTNTLSMRMMRQPPPEWLGMTAEFRPGCNKLYTRCDGDWNNAHNFVGLGVKIPAFNPHLNRGTS